MLTISRVELDPEEFNENEFRPSGKNFELREARSLIHPKLARRRRAWSTTSWFDAHAWI